MERSEAIEIPFGAFDSELKGWEYTIPEGMKARIEGNKIILEPKESDDEKMIRIIEDAICTNEAQQLVKTKYGLELTNLADWLEKQGSQNLANSAKTCKDEQKPAKLPKGEDYGIDGLYAAIDILQKTIGKVDGYQTDDGILEHECAINAVKELYEQNSAWSEEDIKTIERIVCILDGIRYYNTVDNQEKPYQSEVDFLKSLKERYTWKPSEEQIRVLEDSKMRMSLDGYGLCPLLQTLINDLKKLKG